MPDAKGIDQFCKNAPFACLNGLQQIAGGFVCNLFQLEKVRHLEVVQIRRFFDQPLLNKLGHDLVSKTVYPHGSFGNKVFHRFLDPARAGRIGAFQYLFISPLDRCLITDGAVGRHAKWSCPTFSF